MTTTTTTTTTTADTTAKSKPKILLLGTIDHAHSTWQSLSQHAELIKPSATNRSDFIKECQSGKFDGVVAAYRTFASASITGRFDAELLAVLPKSWIWLAHNGAGYDQIDADACLQRDPPLLASNVPDLVNDATADTAIFLVLGAVRNFNSAMQSLRRGEWRGSPWPAVGNDPQGKTLGILGMGGIGRSLKRKAEVGFGMKVIYHNRRRLADEQAAGAEYVGFEELLRRADVVSLHLPLNEGTKHIIGWEQMKMMKRSAIIVNTARGPVVDEAALVRALDEGVIAGAGLDVYEEEPKVHAGLVKNEKVMLLPHMGTWTVETQGKMEVWVMENIKSALEGRGLKSPVPEHVQVNEKMRNVD